MADLRIVDAPVLLQESITDDVKMPTGGLGNFSIRLGDIVWYVVTKEQLANKNYVDLSSKGVKDSLDAHIANKNNPHQVTKTQVGLGNVDNTADIDKPVSNATKSAIITATTDMATKAYVNQKDNLKADKATTLSGYGITDAYTKDETYNAGEIDSVLSLKATKDYVDSKDGDLTTLTTKEKTNLVKAINEINDISKGIQDIATLKEYTPRKNNEVIEVIDYDENVQGIFNKYIYRASSNLDDNYGTVIASNVVDGRWLMLPKPEYVPEDFGVLSGEAAAANNTVRCKNFLESGLSLRIPLKKYKMVGLLSVTLSKPTRIIGQSMQSSILDNLKIVMDEGSQGSELRNFRINTNSLNYSIYIIGGGYSVFDHLYFYHNYDGICTYTTTREVIGNVVSNCISEKSGRIGFTADFGTINTVFINNTAIDCKQGFHFEGAKRLRLINSTTIGCGLNSSLSSGEQDGYAGPLRTYSVEDILVDGFTNISPAGRCYWQHGGGGAGDLTNSRNLEFKNLRGLGALLLDDERAKTENVSFNNIDTFGIYNPGEKQKLLGNVFIENVTGSYGVAVHGATNLTISNANTDRLEIAADNIFLKDVRASTIYWHTIDAKNIVSTGLLEAIQTEIADSEWYHGFHFNMTNTIRMKIENIRFSGMGYGSHLSFAGLTSATKKIDLGDLDIDINMGIKVNGAFVGLDNLVNYNISYNGNRLYHANTTPTSGNFQAGDRVLKTAIGADTIYGWVCTTSGTGATAIWKPLKHDV